MEEGLGERLLQQVKEICEIAGIRTEEAARVGRKRLDVLSLDREITRQKTALGRRVHALAGLPEPGDVLRDPEVVAILTRIRELEGTLAVRAAEIAEIRRAAGGRTTQARERHQERRAGASMIPAPAEGALPRTEGGASGGANSSGASELPLPGSNR